MEVQQKAGDRETNAHMHTFRLVVLEVAKWSAVRTVWADAADLRHSHAHHFLSQPSRRLRLTRSELVICYSFNEMDAAGYTRRWTLLSAHDESLALIESGTLTFIFLWNPIFISRSLVPSRYLGFYTLTFVWHPLNRDRLFPYADA